MSRVIIAGKGLGAEGGLNRNTLFLPFLLEIFDFLRKTASFVFRTARTLSTVSTQLYLSCSQLSNSEVRLEAVD